MSSDNNKEYSVNWNNHMNHVKKSFRHLLASSDFVDVTLFCEGQQVGAHKILLSACSAYFHKIFKDVPFDRPVIVLPGISFSVLNDILHFIYHGEVSVDTAKLDLFLKTAQILQISGLTDGKYDAQGISTSNVKTQESTNSDECYESTTSSATTAEEPPRKKRTARKESAPQPKEESQLQEDDLFLTDIKCEPTEMMVFDEPVEDPLETPEQEDVEQVAATSCTQPLMDEEEIKLGNFRQGDKKHGLRSTSYLGNRLDGSLHVLVPHPGGKHNDCIVCSNRKIKGERKTTVYCCETCGRYEKLPFLHIGNCFKKYHTLKDYKI